MAKKRMKRSVRKAVPKSHPKFRALRIADILVSIAIAFTLVNAVLVLFYADKAVEAAANLGYQTTVATWQLLGVSWIFLSLFAYIANRITRVSMHRPTMWGLLIIGVVLGIISWRLPPMVSAVLIIISALVYISKSRK